MYYLNSEEDGIPFFVYGTLRAEQSNYHRHLFGKTSWEQAATMDGLSLFSMGAFPMAVEVAALPASESGWHGLTERHIPPPLVGELMLVHPFFYAETLHALDELEDYDPRHPQQSMYIRTIREATLTDGRCMKAWVYIGNPRYLTAHHPLIVDGDWVQHRLRHRASLQQALRRER